MSGFQPKLEVLAKGKKTLSKDIQQTSNPDSNVKEMLKFSGREFKITTINMLTS